MLAASIRTQTAVDAQARVSVSLCRLVYRALTELEQWQSVPYKLPRDETIKVRT